MFHGALIEEIGIASGAACSVSGVSIHDHLRVSAAGDAGISYEIEPCRRIILQPFLRRPDPQDGELVQVSPPEELYRNPRTPFVASFVGDANVLCGHRTRDVVTLESGAAFPHPGPDGPILALLRPEAVRLGPAVGEGVISAEGRLIDIVFMGAFVRYVVLLGSGQTMVAVAASGDGSRAALTVGMLATVTWRVSAQTILPA